MSRPFIFAAFLLLGLVQWAVATPVVGGIRPPNGFIFSDTTDYPLPNQGHIHMHDPSIVEFGGYFYLFRGGIHIPVFKSSTLDGPWTKIGTVLDGPSVIEKQNRTRPWAPTVIERNGMLYCFYSLSKPGARNSAIGIATTDGLDMDGGGSWTDHGALVNTEHGPLSHVYPYTHSNAIDASFMMDQKTGQPYLLYGSYWHGIFQVPLSDDLLSVENSKQPDAKHLAYESNHKPRFIEGSFMSYHDPYYYLWFSHGKCCGFEHGLPDKGNEYAASPSYGSIGIKTWLMICRYKIRVGRSKSIRGPFADKSGRLLTDGGGTVVYGSNHGHVYAPGGVGVLPGNDDRQDILYYHYSEFTSVYYSSLAVAMRN